MIDRGVKKNLSIMVARPSSVRSEIVLLWFTGYGLYRAITVVQLGMAKSSTRLYY